MKHNEKKVFTCHLCGKADLRDNEKLEKHLVACEKREEKRRGRSESSVMGPPRGRKTKEDSKEEKKTHATGRGGDCMKSEW